MKKNTPATGQITSRVVSRTANVKFEIGYVLDLSTDRYRIGFELALYKVFETGGKRIFKKIDQVAFESAQVQQRLQADMIPALTGVTDTGVIQHLANDGYSYLQNYAEPWPHFTDNARRSLRKYYAEQLMNLWPWLCRQQHVFVGTKKSLAGPDIQSATLSKDPLQLSFRVDEERKNVVTRLQATRNGEPLAWGQCRIYGGFVLALDGTVYLPDHLPDAAVMKHFEHGYLSIARTDSERVIRTTIPQLQRAYAVDAPADLLAEPKAFDPVPEVLFREMDEKFLVMQPRFNYNGTVVNYDIEAGHVLQKNTEGKYDLIARDTATEKKFYDYLRTLHPKFARPTLSNFVYLPFEDTMRDNWFMETVSGLLDANITVQGVQELKRHRHSGHKAKWTVSAGSGIDWFDLEIELSFGNEIVPLHQIRRALLSGQQIVRLGDGSYGILPADFIKQYGPLLKMGREQKDSRIRLSKLHFTLMDELPAEVKNEGIEDELNEKKQRLHNIGNVTTEAPDKAIKAALRPYQLGGFQWFQTLDELGWGGCLADDMGLGKTLQTITFLQYLKTKYTGSTNLVICPTSLIYNWESELQKFCPTLRYHIYYGTERALTMQHFEEYDVVLSSYGTVRNDVAALKNFGWHYIFLDESQAIKNPDSQTNAALQQMTSRNRMILSGTPVQNNTYDLYAQFNFLNPGLLGTREFFRNEFANPIDKENDAAKSNQLRKLIYPFLLRRTKEQVAKDLPDKTETVIWCTMGKEQREVYNLYKDTYRCALLEKIEEEGLGKAGMDLLNGLLRLRQICDSPALLKNDEVTTKDSTKTNELLREIQQNAGGHKMLVFSQFTEMLHLVEDRLRQAAIPYAYLDGSTPADKRQEAVDRFQEDPEIRVFLISLKAGGTGLNLTAADYVYIVDPWWNPAAEQQAIDRTHRIGQVNKVFAYKMICKDTVEEKILLLQQKKKQLAADLVSEDAGFVKSLTKDDVAFLFS